MIPVASDLGECLVKVQAQVMVWDEKFSGWVPYENGGVSFVSLYQRLHFRSSTSSDRHPSLGNGELNGKLPSLLSTVDQSTSAIGEVAEISKSAMSWRRRVSPCYDYIIESCHMVDKRILLHCMIPKDINYRQVMPTFHHWQIGDKKFGLKFMSSYEACQFHNKLQKAVEHLTRQSKSSSGESTLDVTELEDEVFIPVTLPLMDNYHNGAFASSKFKLQPKSTAKPSAPVIFLPYSPPICFGAVKKRPTITASLLSSTHPPSRKFVPSAPLGSKLWPPSLTKQSPCTIDTAGSPPVTSMTAASTSHRCVTGTSTTVTLSPHVGQSSSHKKIAPSHLTYKYGNAPTLLPPHSFFIEEEPISEKTANLSALKRCSVASVKIAGFVPMLPLKGSGLKKAASTSSSSVSQLVRRDQCRYCRQFYYVKDNRGGSCPDAPDPCGQWTRRLTCVWCVEHLAYHCCPEDDAHPLYTRSLGRWLFVALLALLTPCLWCYPLAWLCTKCCEYCGLVERRHVPTQPSNSPQWSRFKNISTYR